MATKRPSISLSVLVTFDDGIFIAHCLELDLVATGDSEKEAQDDLFGIVRTQLEYAFANNNLDNLLKAAPKDAWDKFLACPIEDMVTKEIPINIYNPIDKRKRSYVTTKSCSVDSSLQPCHV